MWPSKQRKRLRREMHFPKMPRSLTHRSNADLITATEPRLRSRLENYVCRGAIMRMFGNVSVLSALTVFACLSISQGAVAQTCDKSNISVTVRGFTRAMVNVVQDGYDVTFEIAARCPGGGGSQAFVINYQYKARTKSGSIFTRNGLATGSISNSGTSHISAEFVLQPGDAEVVDVWVASFM